MVQVIVVVKFNHLTYLTYYKDLQNNMEENGHCSERNFITPYSPLFDCFRKYTANVACTYIFFSTNKISWLLSVANLR